MFLELIATFAAGIGGAGLMMLLNLMTGGRLPRWAMPVAAGAAMIAVAIASEYSWGNRTKDGLPEGVVVVEEITRSQWYRPWTYVAPQVVRLVALDTASAKENPEVPGVQLMDLYLFARWQPPAKVPQLLRCADTSRADATGTALSDPSQARWQAASPALIAAACQG
ncbi:hypothetical protein TRM7557_00514 [Tritonibacter multivorans]|uniref:Uncharacterized protein n=1 Tax=Tritonibacter multivorans TaxID=928856 RepID=A0A0P1G256_9RHOB|nr:hypothetical protein [Tritonibacter multivorans]MDA7419552.1 hypothetical protein [Tritonibacter multivorans]CUH75693.1 hypothetical protein TRM7557_00514 [Tritonibacter multivorans]SFC62762.1 hypothetical protein SAMN04488049_103269 [Tritonibacter multivorans]